MNILFLKFSHFNKGPQFFLQYTNYLFMVWTKCKKQLKDFTNELNQQSSSTKFDCKFDFKRIEFLDILVYINQQNKLQTTLF